jgi:hypothetical protein
LDSRARELCRIGDSLFSKKLPWNQLCQEIAEHFYPMRADFTSTLNLGTDFSTGLMDSFPVQSRETLGNTISATLRQGEWFSVKTGVEGIDEDPEVARWLEYSTKNYRRLVYDRRANFTAATIEADHDWVAFGNPVLSVEESRGRDHLLFKAHHPRDCAWMVNDDNRVDHLHREITMTARNIIKKWPKTVAKEVRTAAEQDPATTFKIRHVVMPTDDIYGDTRQDRKKWKRWGFISLYVDHEHQVILSESGLPVFNYVVPRLRTLSNIAQGFSPYAINALPDGRTLQSLARIILEQGEKAIDPPMLGRGEAFRDAINIYAGGFTMLDIEPDEDIRHAFQTIETGSISVGMEMQKDVRDLIAESFLLNKLFLPDTREMTAFETNARLAEYRRAALPFYGPIEAEYNLQLLDVGFSLAINNRVFDFANAPDLLKGHLQREDGEPDGELTFSFESPLNTAEGRAMVAAYQESIQIIAGSSQQDPTIAAEYDLRKMTQDAVKGTGAPADWRKKPEEAAEEQDQQAQVSNLMQSAAALREGAGVASDVAGATVQLREAGLV